MRLKALWLSLFIVLLLGVAGARLASPVVTPTPTAWSRPQVRTATATATEASGWWSDQPTMPPWKTPTRTPRPTRTSTLTRTPKATRAP